MRVTARALIRWGSTWSRRSMVRKSGPDWVAAQGTPAFDGDDGVGLLVGAAGDADLLAGRLGVGLAAPQEQDQAAIGEGDVLPIEGGDLGAAQGAGEAEEQDAVVTEVAQGDPRGWRRSWSRSWATERGAASGWGATPRLRRMPRITRRTWGLLGGRRPDPRWPRGRG